MPQPNHPILSNQQHHNFFGRDTSSPAAVKQGNNPVHLFFSEWPATSESWSNLDGGRPNHNVSSSTQFLGHSSDGIAYSKNG